MPSGTRKPRGGKSNGASASTSTSISSLVSGITLSVQESNIAQLQQFGTTQPSLSNLDTTLSLFKEIVPAGLRGKPLALDTGYTLLGWAPKSEQSPNEGLLTIQSVSGIQQVKAYQKTIALQDPYAWMRHGIQPVEPFSWNYQRPDELSPTNQAYLDATACSLVSKLKTHLGSPHFCTFYGAFRAVKDVFRYNLEDDIEDFRFSKWFWNGLDSGLFGLSVMEKRSGRVMSYDEVQKLLRPNPEFLEDDESSIDDEDDTMSIVSDSSDLEAESLDQVFAPNELSYELEDASNVDFPEVLDESTTLQCGSSIKTSSSIDSFSEEYTFHATFVSMPVVVVYLEQLEQTMDSLLETRTFSPIQRKEQSDLWSAWLFQVCAALHQLQTVYSLTHNDLHTNNILWKETDQPYLWYKSGTGQVWRVPTYGKVFCIIDYGRSIFTINKHTCISSDYDDGHDAAGMYNFGPIEDTSDPRVSPNKSFDLCRLACSMVRALYPRNPEEVPNSPVLTKERSWVVRTTQEPLFNMVWTWLRTKDGSNVLETQSGKERYPGFELYAVIASKANSAVPSTYFTNPVFQPFLYTGDVMATCIQL